MNILSFIDEFKEILLGLAAVLLTIGVSILRAKIRSMIDKSKLDEDLKEKIKEAVDKFDKTRGDDEDGKG